MNRIFYIAYFQLKTMLVSEVALFSTVGCLEEQVKCCLRLEKSQLMVTLKCFLGCYFFVHEFILFYHSLPNRRSLLCGNKLLEIRKILSCRTSTSMHLQNH